MPASLPGLYSPLHRYSRMQSVVQKNPWANPGGTQIHSPWSASGILRDVPGDDPAQRGRPRPYIQRQVHDASANGADQLAHGGIPLEMKAADHAGAGETLVDLEKTDFAEKRRIGVAGKIPQPVGFGEIPPAIPEAAESYDLQLGDRERFHGFDLHALLLSPASVSTGQKIGRGGRPGQGGNSETAAVALDFAGPLLLIPDYTRDPI